MASLIKIVLYGLVPFLLATLHTADAFVQPRGELASSAAHARVLPEVMHDMNQVQTSGVRRPPSGPNPVHNIEVNAVSQDVGKRGATAHNVDAVSVAKKELTGVFKGIAAGKDVGKHDTHQVQVTSVRRPLSGPNPEGIFEVNAASQDAGRRGTKVQNMNVASKELTGTT